MVQKLNLAPMASKIQMYPRWLRK